jgi:hypothetical protein
MKSNFATWKTVNRTELRNGLNRRSGSDRPTLRGHVGTNVFM